MAKKKKSSKKKKNNRKQKSGEKKPKAAPLVHQSLGKVLWRLCTFMLVTAGSFYILLYQSIGGNALWKLSLIALFPLAYVATRRQFFQAPGFLAFLKPTGSKIVQGLVAFGLANGLCFLFIRFGMAGRPADDLLARALHGITFVINPAFGFLIKCKVLTWTAFTSQSTVFQASVLLTSVLFYYGCVKVVQLEKDCLPAEEKEMFMLPV